MKRLAQRTWIYIIVISELSNDGGIFLAGQKTIGYDNEDDAKKALDEQAKNICKEVCGKHGDIHQRSLQYTAEYNKITISHLKDPRTWTVTLRPALVGEDVEDLIPFCKNYIIDNLENYEDEQVCGCDISDLLTQGMRSDGTLTYSRAEAIRYLTAWWYDAADFSDYEEFNFGERSNAFDNPEAFMVRMVTEAIAGLLGEVPVIKENWNDEMTLTHKLIEQIKEDVEDLSDNTEVF